MTELVDLNTGATLNVLDEFEMRPYSLSIILSYLGVKTTFVVAAYGISQNLDFLIFRIVQKCNFAGFLFYARVVSCFSHKVKTFLDFV